MPIKKIGEGAQARYNQSRPTISFRAPDPDFKERVQRAAERVGLSVPEYVLRAVDAYMVRDTQPLRSDTVAHYVKAAEQHLKDTERDKLAKALDELTGSFPPEFE